ncbi:hypothetical protein ACLKMH_20790 [Psychromonas sp. KJ10-10]|uniref:hypothetical protein n=1 Tax=Psychromonas sp. KJ10-10 TaxID=3391823 RepID=UPI0039B5A218
MDKIILIAQQLAKEGKTPNTAMIKARLPKNVPLPIIIEGLKLWQENPNKEISEPIEGTHKTNQELATNSFDALLEAKIEEKIKTIIAPLKDEIKQLKAELNALKEK